MNIGIVIGSTRDTRVGDQIAEWILKIAQESYTNHRFTIIDIKDFQLPMYNEPVPAVFADEVVTEEAKPWSEAMRNTEAFIFVTPEYNRNVPSSLKNALDYLFGELNNKAAGIVSYGSSGGQLAAMSLRNMLSVPSVAVVGSQPSFNIFTDFEDMKKFVPGDYQKQPVITMIDQIILWGEALKK